VIRKMMSRLVVEKAIAISSLWWLPADGDDGEVDGVDGAPVLDLRSSSNSSSLDKDKRSERDKMGRHVVLHR
jgi:hypothetical protein